MLISFVLLKLRFYNCYLEGELCVWAFLGHCWILQVCDKDTPLSRAHQVIALE